MSHNTIIIGAGMAGVAAARTLHDAGHAVRVIEARDRIGGRTHTDRSLDVNIDLGASWIHGPLGNPLTLLAERFGVRAAQTDFTNLTGGKVMAFAADGTLLNEDEYATGLQLAAGVVAYALGSVLHPEPSEAHRSLTDLYAHYVTAPVHLTPTQLKGYDYASRIRVQYGDAADFDDVDWRLGARYMRLPGGDLLLHGGGFSAITNGLAQGLSIETGVVVERIERDGEAVRLATNRGAMTCNAAIVTVPLGVLKAGTIAFDPPLPADKQTAIERMGFGNYEKLALRFPYRFWPTEPQRFNYLTDEEPELFTSWLNSAHYTGEPVLVGYHAGSRAQHINRWSDEELIARSLAALRILFGDRINGDVPAPVAYVRTGWERDPFSRGSYSFNRVGQQPGDRRALARPVDERLFFAGEATHPHYYATVHGAYETGIRAAREVMAKMRG